MGRYRYFIIAFLFFVVAASATAQKMDFSELVKTGLPEDIEKALNQGAVINARDSINGWTPLMYAARFNQNPEVLALLLKSGARINARANDGSTPLICAAAYNPNKEVISVLLKNGAHIDDRANGWTALMCAAGFNDNPEVIITLLKAGANARLRDDSGRTALDRARFNNRMKGTEAFSALEKATRFTVPSS